MIRAVNTDKPDIIRELRKNIFGNVYLYIDILIYGIENESIMIWINKRNDEIKQVVLKYYNSFQIYSVETETDYSEIKTLVLKYKPAMISGQADSIRKLRESVGELYEETYGAILVQPYTEIKEMIYIPKLATIEDIEEIACLIYSDKGIGGHYNLNELITQLKSRLKDKTGRNYIIRQEGKIVAHYATYAEAPEVAVMGGLIVSPKCRLKGYARFLHCYLSNILIGEERKAILFCHQDLKEMYLKFGAAIHGEYGKLTLKK